MGEKGRRDKGKGMTTEAKVRHHFLGGPYCVFLFEIKSFQYSLVCTVHFTLTTVTITAVDEAV